MPRRNSLSVTLREIGRIERTLYTLEWLQSPELRRRIHIGLNYFLQILAIFQS
ncbi:hypothetical protein DM800_14505 [Bacillus sp. AY18-3]|nr:hypothetical protein DM800_14505 [Bacillus sp. AY18-3]